MTRTPDKHKILLIDDDTSLTHILSMLLNTEGFESVVAGGGAEGQRIAKSKEFDCIVLDLHMPKIDGFTVCKNLRTIGIMSPILVLSGMTEKINIVKVLKLGADDYLTKPFSGSELTARLQSLIRRNSRCFVSNQIAHGRIVLKHDERRVYFGKESVLLTELEATLLSRLMQHAPQTVTRDVLLKEVWNITDEHTSNRLDSYIKRLRKKLATITPEAVIHTVHASGYRFGE